MRDEVRPRNSDVVTIGIATTSKDPRLKHCVVALVHHTHIGGELYRQGAVITVLPGKQSMERAWFYGLRMVAYYVDLTGIVKNTCFVSASMGSLGSWEAP